MMTVHRIQRLWSGRAYHEVVDQLFELRGEASDRLTAEVAGVDAAAAITVIRLDEIGQGYQPLCSEAIRTLLKNQTAEGGWRNPMVTALAIKALLCGKGAGEAIDRGLAYLAKLQKAEGLWPATPAARLPGDAFTSVFVLLQLVDQPQFRERVRWTETANWFEFHEMALDLTTRKLWHQARRRCQSVISAEFSLVSEQSSR